jgi:ESCRT-II complex subunit VPS25
MSACREPHQPVIPVMDFYDFPPFFTLQLNPSTRNRQLETWAGIIRDKYSGFYITKGNTDELFDNERIKRRLDPNFISTLCDHLRVKGLGEWVSDERFLVYKYSMSEWSDMIHNWAKKSGKINSIESVFGIVHGDDSRGELFHAVPDGIVMKALSSLEQRSKCELIFRTNTPEDMMNCGVKFFH